MKKENSVSSKNKKPDSAKPKDNKQSNNNMPSEDKPTITSSETSVGPQRIGNYKILRKIGEGGMGVVYEAEQQHPKRTVALKVVRGGGFIDETMLKMFQREAQTLARLKHSSIAAIYESGRTEEGQHFFAMELVRGVTLTEWLHSRKIESGMDSHEIKLRFIIFQKICEAVAYAHQRGVIHRDLKPSNILIVRNTVDATRFPSSSAPEIKILDFGLARITDTDIAATTMVTEAGRIQGTLAYMSPEQLRGNPDEIDIRTDIYSLGVIFYQMLTGVLPYEIKRTMLHEIVRVINEEPPRPLSKTWRTIRKPDPDVETILLKALEKNQSRRYQSVLALSEDVKRYLSGQPILARAPSTFYLFRKLVARHKLGFAFSIVVVFLLLVFGAVMTMQANRIAKERDRAQAEAHRVKLEAEAWLAAFNDDLEKAMTLFREALAQHRKVLGNNNPELATHLYNFAGRLDLLEGGVFRSKSKVDLEIEELYREALEIHRRTLPADHPDVLKSIELLASKVEYNEKLEEAEVLYREAISLREKFFLERDSTLVEDIKSLAWILRYRADKALNSGDPARAEPFYRESVELLQKAKPEESWLIPETELALGRCLIAQQRYAEAEVLLIRVHAGSKEAPMRRATRKLVLESLVDLYDEMGKPDKATEYRGLLRSAKD